LPKNLKSIRIYYMNYKTATLIILGLIAGLLIGFGLGLKWSENKEKTLISNTAETAEEVTRNNQSMNDETDLSPVDEFAGSGLVSSEYSEGVYTYTVTTDLPDPGDGKYYEGWLFKSRTDFASTGKLKKQTGGYGQAFAAENDFSGYETLSITLEEFDDQQPETYVLEAEF